jgi:hypothetical protein
LCLTAVIYLTLVGLMRNHARAGLIVSYSEVVLMCVVCITHSVWIAKFLLSQIFVCLFSGISICL